MGKQEKFASAKVPAWGGDAPGDSAQARQRLSEAAFRVLADRGVARTFMAEVARAAGVSRPTLYNYYPTKESLVFGALGLEVEPWLRRLHRRMKRFESPQERLVEGTVFAIRGLPKTQVLRFIAEPDYIGLLATGDPGLKRTLAFTLQSLQPVLELAPQLREQEWQMAEVCYRTIVSHVQIPLGQERETARVRTLLHQTLVPAVGLPVLRR
ncbi:MAG: TetR/AcrR family transcriptional regulator [Halioglobus sp.]|nr:TetR/AcrR family transcriptional regulator [Halioglobus sp.]